MTSEKPPMEKSGEAKPEQLDLAREQGRAYEHALMEMTQKEAHGQQKQVDEYLVGVAVEHAEGTWQRVDGDLEWKLPDRENAHLEVAVRDAADGRFFIEGWDDERGMHRGGCGFMLSGGLRREGPRPVVFRRGRCSSRCCASGT